MTMEDVLKFTRSQELTYTIPASAWTGTAPPYSCPISSPIFTDLNNVEILPSPTISADQAKAMAKAMIMTGTQTNGTITLKAYGTKPTVGLPIVINARGGLV